MEGKDGFEIFCTAPPEVRPDEFGFSDWNVKGEKKLHFYPPAGGFVEQAPGREFKSQAFVGPVL